MELFKIEFTVVIVFHLTVVAISEELEIFRTRPPGEDGWRHGTDWFKIPPSLCNQGGVKCDQFGAKTEQPCSCSCPYANATLLFDNNDWRCLDNAHVRRLLGYNSSHSILFENETEDNPLRLVKVNDYKRIISSPHSSFCPLDLRRSWHIGCNGSVPFDNSFTNVFRILPDFNLHQPKQPQFLWVNETAATQLEGRIIKLGVSNCGRFTNRWLLFKYVGNLKCLAPTLQPIVTTKPLNSTVKPSPSKGTGPAGNSVKALILLNGFHTFLFMLVLGI